MAFRQPVDQFAQAAIVESQRIRLPSAVCQVESASHEGGALKLDAECQDTVSYTSRTVHVKLRSDTRDVLQSNRRSGAQHHPYEMPALTVGADAPP